MRTFHRAIAAACIALLVSSTVVAQGSSEPPTGSPTPLQEAARFFPGGGWRLSLTDWSQIREVHGYPDITSASPIEDRVAMLDSLRRVEPLMLEFGQDGFQLFADLFGWDITDLDWQASVNAIEVLRFREGTDVDAIAQRLLDHGYQERDYRGVRYVWQSLEDYVASGQTWKDKLLGANAAMAFLPDGRTVLSGPILEDLEWFEPMVDAYLDGPPPLLANVALDRMVPRFGRPMAADLWANQCHQFRPRQPTATQTALIHGPPALAKWHGFGAATYRTAADAPSTAMILFDYPPDMAAWLERDGPARIALVQDQPTATFAYVSDSIEGAQQLIEVAPTSDQPHRVLLALDRRQAPFAACA